MKHDAEQSIAMSYVDTIMNSMGCLLVLFLLLTAIRGPLTFGTEETAATEDDRDEAAADGPAKLDRRERTRDTFVLLATATADDGGTIFPQEDFNRGWEVWELTAKPADRDLGPSFALLTLDSAPTDGVRLKKLRPGLPAVQVRVIQGGKKLLDQRVDVRDGTADVWPLKSEEKQP